MFYQINILSSGCSSSEKECKNRLSAYRCHLIASNGQCIRRKNNARVLCQKECGYCGKKEIYSNFKLLKVEK